METQTQGLQELNWGEAQSIAVRRLTKKFSSLAELIAFLNRLTTVLCGKAHEDIYDERTAYSCPIQAWNLSCAHAVGQLLSDTVNLAEAFGKISPAEAGSLQASLDAISQQIYELDVRAFNLYNRDLKVDPNSIKTAEATLGEKRGAIRDRLLEALAS